MPRKSPYEIFLTPDEKKQLQNTVSKYTLPYRDVMRAKIILFAAEGLSNNQIGKKLDLPRQVVSKWRKRFFNQRLSGLLEMPRCGSPGKFSSKIIVSIKALACQLPKELGLPFSKLTHDEIARQAEKQGIVASISGKTVWRWLSKDAIRPWCFRSWIWPRDPNFEQKASRILDLYQGFWEGKALGENDFILSSDEKTSIQARRRLKPTTAPKAGRYGRVENEYERMGALAYMAAWDVRQAKVFGLCKFHNGIESFHELVDLVMNREPYRSANRVFWITDNGSSHRGQASIKRLTIWYPNAIQVHTPIHASWLNQVEIYFSVLQRQVLTPNDFESLVELENRILDFQKIYETIAKPFEWKFTREDLKKVLAKFDDMQKAAV